MCDCQENLHSSFRVFLEQNNLYHLITIEGKAIPLLAWTGPEGSRGLRLPDLKTVST
jgi:hypothetical protein